MSRSFSPRSLCALLTLLLIAGPASASDPWGASAGYYSTATGTGATLKSQLATIMSTGHIQRRYGDFRFSAAITDRDPNNASNILLVYNRQSVSSTWNSGTTWNREHTWPQSRQPGSASNSTTGNLGDPHALRPSNPSVNSNRGNRPFGTTSSSGSNGTVGSIYYYPGDEDAGDTARQIFYSATRYASNGLSLVNGNPSGNQMGDLASLVQWHYADAPDEFERRRNHTIFSQAYNPSYYTNNRNAFVDHPEFVWSVFVDQQNDTRLTLSGGVGGGTDGASTLDLDLGRVYVGGAAPASTSVSLAKNGADGTYYSVRASGDATTDAGDLSRAVAMGGGWSDSFNVGLDVGSTAASGLRTGSVTVDNLDVTTSGGAGRGANDGDDVVNLSFSVLDHPVASFADSTLSGTKVIDFGSVPINSGVLMESFDVFNFAGAGAPSFAADLDVDGVSDPGIAAFSTGVGATSGIAQGGSQAFQATLDTSVAGTFSANYTIDLSGENLPGEEQQTLTLTLMAEVTGGTLPGDYDFDGFVNAADYAVFENNFGSTTSLAADGNGNSVVDAADYTIYRDNFGASSTPPLAVPEPTTLLITLAAAAAFSRRRYL